jgi:hypothetical protein
MRSLKAPDFVSRFNVMGVIDVDNTRLAGIRSFFRFVAMSDPRVLTPRQNVSDRTAAGMWRSRML